VAGGDVRAELRVQGADLADGGGQDVGQVSVGWSAELGSEGL
jgi:hypothetical protein